MKKQTSRAASHSKESNRSLTAVCLLGAVGFACLAAFLGLSGSISKASFIIGTLISGSALAVSMLLLALFKR